MDTTEDTPTDAQLERGEKRGEEIQAVFTEPYVLYHGYRRFAEEILNVDVETWFAPHPNGEAVLDAVEEEVDDPLAIEIAEEHHAGGCAMADGGDESEESILDELAQLWFEAARSSWEEVVSVVD